MPFPPTSQLNTAVQPIHIRLPLGISDSLNPAEDPEIVPQKDEARFFHSNQTVSTVGTSAMRTQSFPSA
jgi:hypothetical protein